MKLDSKKHKRSGSGSYGEYFKLGKGKGVKLLRGRWETKAKALNSRAWRLANKEADLLDIAKDSKVVPKCYGAKIVKSDKQFRVGIVMQHLGNTTLNETGLMDEEHSDVRDILMEALEDVGIIHTDLHGDNIMYYRKKFYAIDFTPFTIKVDKSI
jgi:RIO-like serine/threonine protein kinase